MTTFDQLITGAALLASAKQRDALAEALYGAILSHFNEK